MDYNDPKYYSKKSFPTKPETPMPPKGIGATAADFRKHADEMEDHEILMIEYRKQVDAYYQDQNEKQELFKKDLLESLGVTGHPKADKLYSIAWEKGHATGLSDVYNAAHDMVELLYYTESEWLALSEHAKRNN